MNKNLNPEIVSANVSKEFKSQAVKSILSIGLFIGTYLVLVAVALALTAACVTAGGLLVIKFPRFYTLALGAGLASLGVLILIFLFKFLFKRNKVDRSHLTEITREQEPVLFNMIEDIVKRVDTTFPKHVYLSAQVNASVFYDSGFWSMFFPIRKNLEIGVGLVNTVTKEELKAILAHEFGHFSQKSMKVGSYVYNVNRIIYNLVAENDSYHDLIERWGNISNYFTPFVMAAGKIVQGIQWLLRKVYVVVNKSYMALSREMEFHADEIAARITGSEPLEKSLLRMDVANYAYEKVLGLLESKYADNIISDNLYAHQTFVMHTYAKKFNIPLNKGLPEVSAATFSRFNQSKLKIDDQWASHPSTDDRIDRLRALNLKTASTEISPAGNLFTSFEKTQEQITRHFFTQISFEGRTEVMSVPNFETAYHQQEAENSFPLLYNGYYDVHQPLPNFDKKQNIDIPSEASCLFTDEHIELVYQISGLTADRNSLRSIASGEWQLKTFDYDGVRYKSDEAKQLLSSIEVILKEKEDLLAEHDLKIFAFFRQQETPTTAKLENMYREFSDFDTFYDEAQLVYSSLTASLEFTQFTTPFARIIENFKVVAEHEEKMKENLSILLRKPEFNKLLSEETHKVVDSYLQEKLTYFQGEIYYNDNLNKLYQTINAYVHILNQGYFEEKKRLLIYQSQLLKVSEDVILSD